MAREPFQYVRQLETGWKAGDTDNAGTEAAMLMELVIRMAAELEELIPELCSQPSVPVLRCLDPSSDKECKSR